MSNANYSNIIEAKSMYMFKLVLLGDSSVGKTSITKRIINNTFSEFQDSTIGASFMTKCIETPNEIINYEIWDTAGQERYRALAPMYYRGAHCVFLVFDITNRESFISIKDWEREIKKNVKDIILVILIGNKSDLYTKRKLSEREIVNYAESIGARYYETSAKSGIHIEEMLQYMNKMLPDLYKPPISQSLSLDRNYQNTERRSRCC